MSRRQQFALRRASHDLRQRMEARPFHHFVEDGGEMPAENVNVDKQRVDAEGHKGWLFMYINEADMEASVNHEPDDPKTGQYASGAPLHHVSGRGEQHPTPEVDEDGHVEQGVTDRQVRGTDKDQDRKDAVQEAGSVDDLTRKTTANVTGMPEMKVEGDLADEVTSDNTDGPTVSEEPARETKMSVDDPDEHPEIDGDDEFDAKGVVAGSLKDVEPRIAELDADQLDAVEKAEKNGKGRQGVTDAIDKRRKALDEAE